MRKSFLATALLTILLVVSVSAAVPQLINYQGRLTDPAGDPVADGSYSVVFTIYDAATVGNSKWTEIQNVITTDGLFSVLLGSSIPILDTVFNDPTRYLGIKIETDTEISPRIMMVTVPYAFHASKADSATASETAGRYALVAVSHTARSARPGAVLHQP